MDNRARPQAALLWRPQCIPSPGLHTTQSRLGLMPERCLYKIGHFSLRLMANSGPACGVTNCTYDLDRLGLTKCSHHRIYSRRSWLNGRILSWGSGQYWTDSVVRRAQARARSRRHNKTSEPQLILSKETRSVPKRKDTTCMPPDRPPWAYWDYAPHAAGRLRSDWLNLQTH